AEVDAVVWHPRVVARIEAGAEARRDLPLGRPVEHAAKALDGGPVEARRVAAVEEVEQLGELLLALGQLGRPRLQCLPFLLHAREERRLALAHGEQLAAARRFALDPPLALPPLGDQPVALLAEQVAYAAVAVERFAVAARQVAHQAERRQERPLGIEREDETEVALAAEAVEGGEAAVHGAPGGDDVLLQSRHLALPRRRPARREIVRRRRLGETGLLKLQLGVGRRELVLQAGAPLVLRLQAGLEAGDLGAQSGELLLAGGDRRIGGRGRSAAGRSLKQRKEQREAEEESDGSRRGDREGPGSAPGRHARHSRRTRAAQRKLSSSAASSICFEVGLPVPCPARVSMRIITGADPAWACWRAAANLKLCAGTTRSSWSAVVMRTAG